MSNLPLARKIKELRTSLGRGGRPMPGEQFAEELGTTQATVSRWEKGVKPNAKHLAKLAGLARQSVPEFLYGQQIGVPVISWVSAGTLLQAETVDESLPDDIERIGVSGLGSGDFFALRVTGDSMNKIAPDEAIIIVNRADREVIDKKFFIFSIDGDSTFKRFREHPTRLEPYSYNPEHEAIYPEGDFRTVGRVVRVLVDNL